MQSKWSILIGMAFLYAACDDTRIYDSYRTYPNAWHKDSIATFEVPAISADTSQRYNIFISLRNTNEYPYSNLFLISSIQFPNGKTVVDTLEYLMAEPSGKWLGKGFSDVKENKLWLKENVRFTEEGTYTVSLQHAMRDNGSIEGVQQLEGITDVGIRIEKPVKP